LPLASVRFRSLFPLVSPFFARVAPLEADNPFLGRLKYPRTLLDLGPFNPFKPEGLNTHLCLRSSKPPRGTPRSAPPPPFACAPGRNFANLGNPRGRVEPSPSSEDSGSNSVGSIRLSSEPSRVALRRRILPKSQATVTRRPSPWAFKCPGSGDTPKGPTTSSNHA